MVAPIEHLTVPRSDPTTHAALARTDDTQPLMVSVAHHLIALAEMGRVRCPKVRALVDVFAREVAA